MSQSRAPRGARQAAAAPTNADLITFTLPPDLLARLDEARGGLNRSDAVATVIFGLLRGTAEIVATRHKPANAPASAPATPPASAPANPPAGAPTAGSPCGRSTKAEPLPIGGRPDALSAMEKIPTDTAPAGKPAAVAAVAAVGRPAAVVAVGRPAALASRTQDAGSAGGNNDEMMATEPAAAPAVADSATGSIEVLDFAHGYFRMLDSQEAAPATVVRRTDHGATRSRLFSRGGKGNGAGAGVTAGKQKGATGQLVSRVAAASRLQAGGTTSSLFPTGWSGSGRRVGLIAGAVLVGSAALNFWLVDEKNAVESANRALQADRIALQRQVASAAAQSRDLAEKVRRLERGLQTARADLRLLHGSQYNRDSASPTPTGPTPTGPTPTSLTPTSSAPTSSAPTSPTPARDDTPPLAAAVGQAPPRPVPLPFHRRSPVPVPMSPSIDAAAGAQRPKTARDPATFGNPGTVESGPVGMPPLVITVPAPRLRPAEQPDPSPPAHAAVAADRPLPAIPRPKPPVPAGLRDRAAAPAGAVVIQRSPQPGSPGLPSRGLLPQLVPQAMVGGSGSAALPDADQIGPIGPIGPIGVGSRPQDIRLPASPIRMVVPSAISAAPAASSVDTAPASAPSPVVTGQVDPIRDSVQLAPPAASIGGADQSRFEMIVDPYYGLRSGLSEN